MVVRLRPALHSATSDNRERTLKQNHTRNAQGSGTKGSGTKGFGTRAVHAGQEPDPTTGAIMTPVYLTSTYVQESPGVFKGYDYSRTRNPTRTALDGNLAALEGCRRALAFSSGMGAINTILNLLSAGDHVVAGNDLYGGTYRIFTTIYARYGMTFSFVDTTDIAEVERALRKETKLIFVETPSNPLLRITDLAGIAKIGKARNILTVCDNTFATPYLQNPLALGIDIVTHSMTKYLGGHSDVVGGALCLDDEQLADQLHRYENSVGATPGALDCFLVMRGTKTLHLRMERHCDNAERVVAFLRQHPRVETVHYPGLPSHHGHEIAQRQMKRFGGMVSFELKASVEESRRVASRMRLFALAESLGGVESLVDHPASMTHASIPAEERKKAGLQDGLIRLSVGVEDHEDLIEDLAAALGD
jgi:cystathionine beta-lyase/cystathionine gamma-synthase